MGINAKFLTRRAILFYLCFKNNSLGNNLEQESIGKRVSSVKNVLQKSSCKGKGGGWTEVWQWMERKEQAQDMAEVE